MQVLQKPLMQIKHFRHVLFALLAVLPLALLLTPSCGKRKPPLPPVERVLQRVRISGTQIGNEIRVTWQMPARNAPDGSVLNIQRAEIYRLAEPLRASLTLTESEFASRSTLIGSVPITNADFALKRMSFTDKLELAGQPVRLRYAVRFVNDEGQRAAFSNFLLIEPTAGVAEAPKDLSSTVSQDSISLSWQAPTGNVDGSTPANVIGYNIYRTNEKGETRRLNSSGPVNATTFNDELFTFGDTYSYRVRTVSLGTNADQIESTDSNVDTVTPKDTFAPSAPSALTIAASPTEISLFFAANPEDDVAGYRVYRSTDRSKDLSEWTLMTPQLLDITSFQDKNVNPGVTYYYYVKAVDKRGNVSDPSEVVSESAF